MREHRIMAEVIVKRLFRENVLGSLDAIELVEEILEDYVKKLQAKTEMRY
jgi:hypothetical protein